MVNVDKQKAVDWCLAAVSVLEASGRLDSEMSNVFRASIARHSKSNGIFKIAEDLAMGIRDMPQLGRADFVSALRASSPIDYTVFLEKRYELLKNALKRGKILTANEHRAVLDAASDTTQQPSFLDQCGKLLAEFERERRSQGPV